MIDIGNTAIESLDVGHQSRRRDIGCVGGIERINIRLAGVQVLGIGVARGLRHVVVGLRPGVIGHELEPVRHLLQQSGLEGIEMGIADHGRFNNLGVALVATRGCEARPDRGSRFIDPSGVGGGGAAREGELTAHDRSRIDSGVHFQFHKLMARCGTDIGQPRGPVARKLLLEGQVEVVGDRHMEVAGRIVFVDLDLVGKDLRGLEGQGEGEGVGVLSCRVAGGGLAVRIAERPAGTASGLVHVGEGDGDGVGDKC